MPHTEAVCRSVESRTLAFARVVQASVLEAVEVSMHHLPWRSHGSADVDLSGRGTAAQAAMGEIVVVLDTIYDTASQLVSLHREFVRGLMDLTGAPAEAGTAPRSEGLRSVG